MSFGPIGDWPNDKSQTLKADFSISYFSIPQGPNDHNFVWFKNASHHYKWENVYEKLNSEKSNFVSIGYIYTIKIYI